MFRCYWCIWILIVIPTIRCCPLTDLLGTNVNSHLRYMMCLWNTSPRCHCIVCKHLRLWFFGLSPLTGKSDYTVTNSTHFVSIITHERIKGNKVMVSFDIESCFTNVPIEGAVKAALCKLENDPGLADRTNLTPTQICRPFKLCLKIHVFPVQRVDLRTKRRSSYGEPSLRGYC